MTDNKNGFLRLLNYIIATSNNHYQKTSKIKSDYPKIMKLHKVSAGKTKGRI